VHPPLDYLLARGLETIGPLDWARKLPDVLWGAATVPVIGLLVARRAGRVAGLITAALLALAPFHVRYSQEFRPYALGLFLLCLSLLCLDRFLERPGMLGLVALYIACLSTAYTLYLAAMVLGLAALAILVEDSLDSEQTRRRNARRFLLWSPLFAATLFLAYLPWWPVVVEAARRPPMAAPAPVSLERIDRLVSFFLFAPDGGHRLGWPGGIFLAVVLTGAAAALRSPRTRFLPVWALGGLAVIEILGRIHPHYDFARRFLPAGIAFPALAAVGLASLGSRAPARLPAAALLAGILTLDARSLGFYFREGRGDWRPLGQFLRSRPKSERVFTENQYAELCVAFYVEGPQWLFRGGHLGRDVWNLDGEIVRLTWSWRPGEIAWLVLAGEPEYRALRAWARRFPTAAYPSAEGALLVKLDPAMRNVDLPP
jgi:4-amino-4-deoxy-L-arabinose transferase-like glycosyltransferase